MQPIARRSPAKSRERSDAYLRRTDSPAVSANTAALPWLHSIRPEIMLRGRLRAVKANSGNTNRVAPFNYLVVVASDSII